MDVIKKSRYSENKKTSLFRIARYTILSYIIYVLIIDELNRKLLKKLLYWMGWNIRSHPVEE